MPRTPSKRRAAQRAALLLACWAAAFTAGSSWELVASPPRPAGRAARPTGAARSEEIVVMQAGYEPQPTSNRSSVREEERAVAGSEERAMPESDGGAVRGRVVDQDGIAVEQAIVRLSRGSTRYQTRLDRQGRFCFENLPRGRYRVQVDGRSLPEGTLPPWRQHVPRPYLGEPTGTYGTVVPLPQGAERVVDLRVFAAAAVRGRVVGPAGESVPNATVSIRSCAGPTASTRTDPWGAFHLTGVYPGEYTIGVRLGRDAAWPAASSPLPKRFELFAGESRELRDLVVGRGGHVLVGRVVDQAGRPVVGLPVACHELPRSNGAPIWRARTDAAGRYELGRIPSTAVEVSLGPDELRGPLQPGLLAKPVAPIPIQLRGAPDVLDLGRTEVERTHPFRLRCRVQVDHSSVDRGGPRRTSIEVEELVGDGSSIPVFDRPIELEGSSASFTWDCDTPRAAVVLRVAWNGPRGEKLERRITVHPVPDATRDEVVRLP